MREEKHNKPMHKSCRSNLDLEVGRDGESVTVPGRVVPSRTATASLAASPSDRAWLPRPPRTCLGLGSVAISLSPLPGWIGPTSIPQFLSVLSVGQLLPCCTRRCVNQLRNPYRTTSTPELSFHFLHFLRGLLGTRLTREGRRGVWTACWKAGSCREVSHPRQLWKARPHCIWDLFICREAFLWRDNAKRMSINCKAKA